MNFLPRAGPPQLHQLQLHISPLHDAALPKLVCWQQQSVTSYASICHVQVMRQSDLKMIAEDGPAIVLARLSMNCPDAQVWSGLL